MTKNSIIKYFMNRGLKVVQQLPDTNKLNSGNYHSDDNYILMTDENESVQIYILNIQTKTVIEQTIIVYGDKKRLTTINHKKVIK